MNFSSRQQNKIPNHNRNKNHHFSGHQTLPVLPLQNQNFRQILSQKVGLEFSAFSLDQDAIFNSHFATSVSKGRIMNIHILRHHVDTMICVIFISCLTKKWKISDL